MNNQLLSPLLSVRKFRRGRVAVVGSGKETIVLVVDIERDLAVRGGIRRRSQYVDAGLDGSCTKLLCVTARGGPYMSTEYAM